MILVSVLPLVLFIRIVNISTGYYLLLYILVSIGQVAIVDHNSIIVAYYCYYNYKSTTIVL